MTEHRCYIRTILLSILAAFIIDAVVNFDEYKEGWVVGVRQEKKLLDNDEPRKVKLPVKIGKVTGMIYDFVF